MTEFGLKIVHRRAEALQLEAGLEVPSDVISALTNFQVDAIRFLWEKLRDTHSCIYNDGSHMGKRITIAALASSLVRDRQGTHILIACAEEAIIPWIFKLKLFFPLPPCSLYSGTKSDDPITFVNISARGVDWKKLVAETAFTMIVLDVPTTSHRFKFSPFLASSAVTVIYSADVVTPANSALLGGFLRCFNYSSWYSHVLRRTNEEHLREFPWLDQNQFRFKLQQWKGGRTTGEIIEGLRNPPAVPVVPVEPIRVMEESQEMSALLFETDDEGTPVKDQERPPLAIAVHSNSLLSSMYLRISQSFAHNHTPKQKIVGSTAAVQDSPDLFASILDGYSEAEDRGDVPNEFNISTPLSTNGSSSELEIPSQSPINSAPTEEFDIPAAADTTLVNNKSAVFDITTNEVFASKIKVTTSQNYQPVEEEDEEQLKFDTQDILLRTPTRKTSLKRASASPTTPTSSGWLSKRAVHKRTPEKVLVKKRKSLIQFYNSSGESRNGNGASLDFSSLDDEHTQRWNACSTSTTQGLAVIPKGRGTDSI